MSDKAPSVHALVEQHGPAWLGEDGPIRVEVLAVDRRRHSRIHHLRIVGAQASKDVVVKVLGAPRRPDRPVLDPAAERPATAQEVAAGLRLADRTFRGSGDSRLAVVELVDQLPEIGALVLGRHPEPSLRQRSGSVRWGLPPSAFVRRAHEDTGRWMRTFHGIEAAGRPVLRGTREEAVAAMEGIVGYIASRRGHPEVWEAIRSRAAEAATVLPAQPTLGLRHDDCAPRNFLVSDPGVVTGIDFQVRWMAPVYEDIGHYLMASAWSPMALLTQGRVPRPATTARLEEAFLRGYFGDEPIPWGPVRWYQALMLLDRWSAWIAAAGSPASTRARVELPARLVVGRPDVVRRVRALLEASAQGA